MWMYLMYYVRILSVKIGEKHSKMAFPDVRDAEKTSYTEESPF
jgi:hypothetical protein